MKICSFIKLCYPKQGCRAPYSGFWRCWWLHCIGKIED